MLALQARLATDQSTGGVKQAPHEDMYLNTLYTYATYSRTATLSPIEQVLQQHCPHRHYPVRSGP